MTPLAIPAWLARFWQACRIVRRFELTPRARVVDACAAVSVTSMARLRGSKDSQILRGKKRLSGRTRQTRHQRDRRTGETGELARPGMVEDEQVDAD